MRQQYHLMVLEALGVNKILRPLYDFVTRSKLKSHYQNLTPCRIGNLHCRILKSLLTVAVYCSRHKRLVPLREITVYIKEFGETGHGVFSTQITIVMIARADQIWHTIVESRELPRYEIPLHLTRKISKPGKRRHDIFVLVYKVTGAKNRLHIQSVKMMLSPCHHHVEYWLIIIELRITLRIPE